MEFVTIVLNLKLWLYDENTFTSHYSVQNNTHIIAPLIPDFPFNLQPPPYHHRHHKVNRVCTTDTPVYFLFHFPCFYRILPRISLFRFTMCLIIWLVSFAFHPPSTLMSYLHHFCGLPCCYHIIIIRSYKRVQFSLLLVPHSPLLLFQLFFGFPFNFNFIYTLTFYIQIFYERWSRLAHVFKIITQRQSAHFIGRYI